MDVDWQVEELEKNLGIYLYVGFHLAWEKSFFSCSFYFFVGSFFCQDILIHGGWIRTWRSSVRVTILKSSEPLKNLDLDPSLLSARIPDFWKFLRYLPTPFQWKLHRPRNDTRVVTMVVKATAIVKFTKERIRKFAPFRSNFLRESNDESWSDFFWLIGYLKILTWYPISIDPNIDRLSFCFSILI